MLESGSQHKVYLEKRSGEEPKPEPGITCSICGHCLPGARELGVHILAEHCDANLHEELQVLSSLQKYRVFCKYEEEETNFSLTILREQKGRPHFQNSKARGYSIVILYGHCFKNNPRNLG